MVPATAPALSLARSSAEVPPPTSYIKRVRIAETKCEACNAVLSGLLDGNSGTAPQPESEGQRCQVCRAVLCDECFGSHACEGIVAACEALRADMPGVDDDNMAFSFVFPTREQITPANLSLSKRFSRKLDRIVEGLDYVEG